MNSSVEQTALDPASRATPQASSHYSVLVIGGGQAGLSMSHYLQQAGIDHLVFEKSTAMHVWQDRRWDSFCLVTPNWQCNLPGHPYTGDDPHGFMVKHQIVEYLAAFKARVAAPVHEGVTVQRVSARSQGGFDVLTSEGRYTADQVVVASGGYHLPVIPRLAERLPGRIVQVHSEQYRNAGALPEGAVLVVGSGQSGSQIAEDLHLAGRKVCLAVGGAPRCARFYRGKDVVDWLADMNYYDMPVDLHPLREGVRDNTNHYVTGRDGGRDIDLRRFANEGMELFGTLDGLADGSLTFKPDLAANLDAADKIYNGINASIDKWIEKNALDAGEASIYEPVWKPTQERTSLDLAAAGISAIVWCIGFSPDFAWLDLPVFNGRGQPGHVRGVSRYPGVYFLGLPWLYTWGSGRFSGVSRDAEFLGGRIAQYQAECTARASLAQAPITRDEAEATAA